MSTPRGGPRAVLLTTDFKPLGGGIAEYLDNLYAHLARYVPVSIVTTVPGATDACGGRDIQLVPATDRRLGERWGDNVPWVRRLHTARYFAALQRQADRTVRSLAASGAERPPQVFIGLWNDPAGSWCAALRRARVPYTLHVYGKELVEPRYPRMAASRIQDMRGAASVVAVSRATAAIAGARFDLAKPAEVVRPGVTAPRDRPAIARRAADLRRSLGLGDARVVASIGRLVNRKGIDRLLTVLPAAAANAGPVVCLVAGDGPERARLEDMARRVGPRARVHFLGVVDEVTKWAVLDLCDLFALVTHDAGGCDFEGFGMAFLEAAVMGKPSVGGASGGVGEAIEDGVTGVLVPPADGDAIAAALASLLGDDRRRRQMGERACARATIEFGWPRIARDFAGTRGWLA